MIINSDNHNTDSNNHDDNTSNNNRHIIYSNVENSSDNVVFFWNANYECMLSILRLPFKTPHPAPCQATFKAFSRRSWKDSGGWLDLEDLVEKNALKIGEVSRPSKAKIHQNTKSITVTIIVAPKNWKSMYGRGMELKLEASWINGLPEIHWISQTNLAISIPNHGITNMMQHIFLLKYILVYFFQVFVLILLKPQQPRTTPFLHHFAVKKKTDWQPLPRRLGAWRFQAAPVAPPRGIQSTPPVMRRFPLTTHDVGFIHCGGSRGRVRESIFFHQLQYDYNGFL